MKQKRITRLWQALSVVLAVGLLIGICVLASGFSPVEPNNPIASRRAEILVETAPGTTQESVLTESTEEPEPTEPTEMTQEATEFSTEPTRQAGDSEPTQQTDNMAEPTEPTNSGGETEEPRIVTDLTNRVITFGELTDDTLHFYAYLLNGEADMYLRVRLRNSLTPQNGSILTPSGRNYQAVLAREESSTVTIYLRQGETTLSEVSFTLRYIAEKADEDNPNVGDAPPVITTNLDGVTDELTNANFTFLVRAEQSNGRTLPASNLLVTMDGAAISNPTGSGVFEYELTFPKPTSGDASTHTVTVLAWDNAGNSAYRSYEVTYHYIDDGDKTGTATIYLDATVVGLAPEDLGGGFVYEIKQNEPASYAVLAMLDALGYEAQYSRTPDEGFYLRRVSRGGMCDYASIPDALWAKVLADGLTLTGQSAGDSLGEYDYTHGSGWMYSVNGTLYAGKSLSSYFLSDGDVLYLRFTLAFGKDIGGYTSTGGSYGLLPTYCGRWVNGGYIDEHQWGEPTCTTAPTCTLDGQWTAVCAVCGDSKLTQLEPALGHDFIETARQEPTQDFDGWIDRVCSRCGATDREILPALGENAAWRNDDETNAYAPAARRVFAGGLHRRPADCGGIRFRLGGISARQVGRDGRGVFVCAASLCDRKI